MATVPFSVESRKVDTGETEIIVFGEVDMATAGPLDKAIGRANWSTSDLTVISTCPAHQLVRSDRPPMGAIRSWPV